MSIIKSLKAKTFAGEMAASAMTSSVPARADWVADVIAGLDTAVANTQSIACAVVVGCAAIFCSKWAT